MRVLGVDPGVRGGLAIVSFENGAPEIIEAINIPTVGTGAKERVDVLAIHSFIEARTPQHALIERAQGMPKQGASSGFKYGRAVGAIEAAIASQQRALQLFPAAHALLARKKDHGRAEAALIALAGVNHGPA